MNSAHLIGKPLTVAATAAAISYYQTKEDKSKITVMGMKMPTYLFQGLAAGVGSLTADVLHTALFPTTELNAKWSSPVAETLSVATSVGIQAAVLMLTTGNSAVLSEIGWTDVGTTAIGGEIAGSYIYDKFVAPMVYNQDQALMGVNY